MRKNRTFKIYLFRHGQTTYNRDNRFTGWNNPRLSRLGLEQAHKIALELKNHKFEIAIHTKLNRSKQTLKEVLKYHPECKKIIEDDRMIERNYGLLNGVKHKSFAKKYGQERYEHVHRGFYVRPPKGESFKDVEKRVGSFIKDLINLIRREKKNVAISAHGNSIRLFRKIMEKASVEETIKWVIPYDNFFIYEIKI